MKKFLLPLLFALTAFAEDGRVAIRSNPPGVSIYEMAVASSGEKSIKKLHDTTVAGKYILLALPLGEHSLIFEKEFFLGDSKKITVTDKIQKIDVTLKEYLFTVDVVFLEEGWQVYMDRKPYLVDGKPIMAPSTIKIAQGRHEVRLVKKGFNDIIKRVDVNKNQQLIVEGRPRKGLMTVTRAVVRELKAEIDLNNIDLDNISINQWEKIKGKIVVVSAKKKLDTKITVNKNEKILVLPHPTDSWIGWPTKGRNNYKGLSFSCNNLPAFCLCCIIGNEKLKYGLITKTGHLYLSPNEHSSGNWLDNKGYIRVKILKIK